ncbi:TetR/AcrR family transcriptional regulator [Curtobacterium ammoniigenes]|uniref:TetR/AcrR family transcriptional regulator n=1 Tax=Curtobacterium ammoniigenes TaxID=395387 RepID=UPI00082ACD40|nr:TetR/AcrR family transcriptional regulator [Curtobacterium ammoniigenes]
MPRKPDPTLKPAIIRKVAEHLRTTPLESVSVRSLAQVLGTSAYPVVYHFGNRANLIDAIVVDLADNTRSAALDPNGDQTALAAFLLDAYGGLDDPDRALAARLAFEVGAVAALTGRAVHRTLHERDVTTVTAWCATRVSDPVAARTIAERIVLAARGAQWGALLDDRFDLDGALRAVAHTADERWHAAPDQNGVTATAPGAAAALA